MNFPSLFFSDRNPSPPPGEDPGGRGGGGKRPMGQLPGRQFRALTFWLLFVLLAIVLVNAVVSGRAGETEVTYTEFWKQVKDKNITDLLIDRREVKGEFRTEVFLDPDNRRPGITRFKVHLPAEDPELATKVWNEIPELQIRSRPESTPWFSVFFSWTIPLLAIFILWIFFIRQMQSGGSAALKFGKSKAKILNENTVKVTFRDVAGADEAKEELQEIIEFLREPKKFTNLGGRIPKGALLLGPPGTGKTLLAKAVAGEASVPFFSMSGSDFVEMFVGVGASRVRDLFEQGKKNAPCIIFIDEIDAVGRHRGAGLGGGHDEREQTLNQLLVEMDGFESTEGVIMIAATNRPDVLDPALLRPGRFDRQIVVDLPDARGREGILKVHARGKPMSADVDLKTLAKGTPGMSGADLSNVVNEAALLAARKNHKKVTMTDFDEAKDRVMIGAERKSLVLADDEKKTTAYHESGHALVGWLVPESDPIHKVTVIPRGRALGVTHSLPDSDKYTHTRDYYLSTMARIMGGRAAEELIFGKITTGAANDIQKATSLARKMVCEWGMSEKLGPLHFGQDEESVFLGRDIGHRKEYSDRTAETIDDEVHTLVTNAYATALNLLQENLSDLHALAQALLEREVLDHAEIFAVLNGDPLDDKESPDDEPTPPDTPPPLPVDEPDSGHPVLRPNPLPRPSGA